MSDETPPPPAADAPSEAPVETPPAAVASEASAETPGTIATVVEDAPAVPVAPAAHAAPAERVTFRSRFLMPLIVPLAVAASIAFFILNISRLFLASEGALAVTFISIITVVILGGGTAMAAAPKMRSQSIVLVVAGGLLFLLMAGLISIGAASPSGPSGPTQCAPVKQKITITAGVGNALTFTPNQPAVKAGCIQINFVIATSSHTLQFDTPAAANVFQQLSAAQKSWAAVLPAGKYAFHCTVDGHAAAGMVGTLTVTS